MTKPGTPREMDTESDLELPSLGRTLRLFGRAFTLRCPNCGKGPVLHHPLKLRVKCGTCGMRMQRGEHDSFLGAIFVLFTLVGLANYALLLLTAAVTETTPWDLLQWGLPVVTLVLLCLLYPFAKLGWLAFDLMLRPMTPAELEWHRDSDIEFEVDRDV
jgi:uncharacterized protein (DUF983 family)